MYLKQFIMVLANAYTLFKMDISQRKSVRQQDFQEKILKEARRL